MGWNEAGLIPGYMLRPDRAVADTRIFWKALTRSDRV
jgi:hypothetical protein